MTISSLTQNKKRGNMLIREQIRRDISVAISNFKFLISNEEIEVTRTTDARHGDFSTNVALKVTRDQLPETSKINNNKQSPQETARFLTDSLKDLPYVEKLEVAGPGFINFFIKSEYWQRQVEDILNNADRYMTNDYGKGRKARVEYVSANPTGPLHFGNARGGPIGDVLANVFSANGYEVVREYYHNDIGGQVAKLGQSILNVIAGKPLEEQEYKGEYVRELADKLGAEIKQRTSSKTTNVSVDLDAFGRKAVNFLKEEIMKDCADMGIKFDEVYSESGFVESGQTKQDIDHLKEKGVIKIKDGADWFAPQDEFLEDRETVVVKSDGSFTYFANDIAYHDLKFKDSPQIVVDVFGANHHGHVPRLKAAVSALGHDPQKFHVILYQWVRFKRGGELVKMSKRSGTFVTAREVLDEVGCDALRFFILMHDANSHIDFDLDLAKQKSKENPVYYVQYAHARIVSILAKVKVKVGSQSFNYKLLTTDYELDLIKQITRLPELVEDIASNFAVHRLTSYAIELADSFHRFYENCPVISDEQELMNARVGLISATKIALENTLGLLGVSAPEKM